MAEVLKKFGRYFLLDRLAQGGMAEIFRARLATKDASGRLIVIKRIQTGYGTNAEFLEMFRSEIKVTMGLSHPNICQLFDFGDEQNQPYIVMEYVDGRNLRQFISRFSETKKIFPVEIAAYIIEQSACGLHYAHTFKEKITGRSLNIIHRDISPQNILISYEGNVKVIDFGIAKAATNNEATRAGVIKGKPSYLSPEQVSGEKLDARCDIFALGTVFWELLTGRKLFSGENDLAVLKLIESSQSHVKPPSTINPKVPRELDYIILKALAKRREERYQSADELQRALHKFLYAYMPDFNPSDLSYYAKDLFKSEIVEDRKRIQRLNDKAEHLIGRISIDEPRVPQRNATDEATSATVASAVRSTGARELAGTDKNTEIQIEAIGDAKVRPSPRYGSANATPPRSVAASRSEGRGVPIQDLRQTQAVESTGGMRSFALGIAAVLLGIMLFAPGIWNRMTSVFGILDQTGTRLDLQGDYMDVSVSVDGNLVANRLPATLRNLPVNSPIRVQVEGHNGLYEQEILLSKNEVRSLPIVLKPKETKRMVTLKLNINPLLGSRPRIMLNNEIIDPGYPAARVPVDSHLELLIRRPGYRFLKREFTIESSRLAPDQRDVSIEIPLEPVKMGSLTLHSTPSSKLYISVDGEELIRDIPLEKEPFPVGTYTIRLINKELEMEKTLSLTIRDGLNTNLGTVNLDLNKR
ncbi:MAG: serine/threonine-protein kinase [Bdellovibrionota bacterium]